jgi:hypothetical protein
MVGCNEPAATAPVVSDVVTPAAESAKGPLRAPDFTVDTKLALLNGSTGGVKIGMDAKEALTVFAKPPSSWNTHDLPPSISGTFEAAGWQNKDEGFGMILNRGRVAAALHSLERTSESRLSEEVDIHEKSLREPLKVISGKFVRYWFWQDVDGKSPSDQVLLMICATEIQPGKWNVAEAIGTRPMMDALGMTPEHAAVSQRVADKLLDEQRRRRKPNSVNSSNRGAS